MTALRVHSYFLECITVSFIPAIGFELALASENSTVFSKLALRGRVMAQMRFPCVASLSAISGSKSATKHCDITIEDSHIFHPLSSIAPK